MRAKQMMAASVLALVLGAVPALAQGSAETVQPARMAAMMTADFAEIDADGDGRISPEEWATFLTERREAMRARMLDRVVEALFEAGDADGDGLLSPDELATAMQSLHAERMEARAAWREERGEMRGEMRPRARGERGMRAERGGRYGRMEGRMGRMGHMAGPGERAERLFQRIDADGDGYISPEELSAAQERWAERVERHGQWRGEGRGRGLRGNSGD